MDRNAPTTTETSKPAGWAVALAALTPFVAAAFGTVLLVVVREGPQGLIESLHEGGTWAMLTLASAALATLVVAVLLALAARGVRVPSAVTLAVAALPWIVGLAGVRWGAHRAAEAATGSRRDPSEVATMFAAGISEALHCRLLGTWCTAGLAAATAFALAFAAVGQRAPGRHWAGALIGAVTAIVVVVVVGALAALSRLGALSLVAVVAPAGGVIACALAGLGAGRDEPHARSASLAAAVPLALVLALAASIAFVATASQMQAFAAMGAVDASDRSSIIAQIAVELGDARTLLYGGLAAALVPALALAVWSLVRAGASVGRVAGGVVAVIVVLAAMGIDALALGAVGTELASLSRLPWEGVAGFRPIEIHGGQSATEPDAIVAVDRLVPRSGAAVPLAAGRDALAATMRPLLHGERAPAPAPPPPPMIPDAPEPTTADGSGANEAGRDAPSALDGERGEALRRALERGILGVLSAPATAPVDDRLSPEPSIALAIHRDIPAASLRALLEAASAAGAKSVIVIGAPLDSTSPEVEARIERNAPFFAGLWRAPRATRIYLEGAVPAGAPERDETLWHATVGAEQRITISARASSTESPVTIELADRLGRARPGLGRVYLAIGPQATTDTVVRAADRLTHEEREVVVVTGATPGSPDQPASAGLGTGTGTRLGGGGVLGVLRAPADPAQVGLGNVDARGSLDREVIRRVIRTELGAVRMCYERELTRAPSLRGNVTVRFTIGADGAVEQSEVAQSSLGNPNVEQCISRVVRRLRFPSPQGGVVVVNYPFILQPS